MSMFCSACNKKVNNCPCKFTVKVYEVTVEYQACSTRCLDTLIVKYIRSPMTTPIPKAAVTETVVEKLPPSSRLPSLLDSADAKYDYSSGTERSRRD